MQIVCKGLNFTYNKKSKFASQALRDVNLTIEDGDFFGIIGQTGSGKSTFIQHINGLIPVQEGELIVGEYNLSEKTKKRKYKNMLMELRKRVGIVFQYPEYQLFGETIFEDVSFGVRNFYPEKTNEEVERDVCEVLSAVGLDYDEIKNKSPFELSGGKRRRVAIAGVLVTKPEVLILDEPVAGLDPKMKKQLMNILHSIHKKFVKTIIIVSHDMNEVNENCNKIAVFKDGTVERVGTPLELFKDSNYLYSLRLDVPVTSYLEKRLREVGVEINSDLSLDNFIDEVVKRYKEIK